MFTANEDVVFGDVNLRDAGVRSINGEPQSPGAGGWPTVRYYNSDTGLGGKPYPKKTSKRMCEELGDVKYMREYVEEMGSTSLCSIHGENKGCSDREKKYILKASQKSKDEIAKQLNRLNGMKAKKMKPNLQEWVNKRLAILKQFQGKEEL